MTEAPRLRAELIFNPTSGRSRWLRFRSNKTYAEKVAQRLRDKHQWDITATPTAKPGDPGDASELAAKAVSDGKKVVIVVAGDGTINEAESKLSGTGTILGAVPRGGMNMWGRETRMPRTAKRTADALANGVVHDIDTVTVEQTGAEVKTISLSAVLGLGYDGLVFNAVHTPGETRKKGGVMQYFKQAIRKMPEAHTTKATITVDNNKTHTVNNLLQLWVHNTQNLAFVRYRKDAKCDDGQIELTALEGNSKSPRRNVLAMIPKLVRDWGSSNDRPADETRLQGKRFHIIFGEPLFGEYDGEPLQPIQEVTVFVNEGASRRLVPQSRRSRVFSKRGIPLSEVITPSAGR